MATPTTQDNGKYTFVARYGEAIVRGGIAAIPYALYRYQGELRLTPQQVWFISAILGQKWTTQYPCPSLKKMALYTGVSRVTLNKIKNELVGPNNDNPKWLRVIERKNARGGKTSSYYDFSPLFDKLVELLERDKPLHHELEETTNEEANDMLEGPHVNMGLHTHVNQSSHTHVNPGLHVNTEEYISEINKADVYPSNIRKAKSDGTDYGNSDANANGVAEGDSATQKEEVGYSQPHSSTNGRNFEENEKYKHFAREQHMRSSPPHVEPPRKGGLGHIGQTLQGKLPIASPTVPAAEARDAIERLIRDTAAKLHDEAPLKSSTTRAFNLYQRSGVDLGTFYTLMYDAEKEANRRSATIKKLTTQGYKNRMVYFFALLEDKLGFREKGSSPVSAN